MNRFLKSEHNERFKDKLIKSRAIGVDMETATLFTVGYHNGIPNAALLLVSDLPMTPEGVKTEESDKKMVNFKKKYNRMFDKYHKELKEVIFNLDKKIGSI